MDVNSVWKTILQNKKQCASWADEPVPRHIIEEILNEMYLHTHSKQNKMPFTLHVVNEDNKSIRETAFKATLDLDENENIIHANTQTLAPTLFIFTPRDEDLHDNVIKTTYNMLLRAAAMEIGLAAMLIALSASAKGYSVGFTACFNDVYREELKEKLNTEHTVLLILGIGKYEKKESQQCFFDNKKYPVNISTSPDMNDRVHIKPPKEDIIIRL